MRFEDYTWELECFDFHDFEEGGATGFHISNTFEDGQLYLIQWTYVAKYDYIFIAHLFRHRLHNTISQNEPIEITDDSYDKIKAEVKREFKASRLNALF